ncbi:MAG: class I SAM-dependent methyltransferase [Bryobacteraceae bacterium]
MMNCDPIARLYRWIEYAAFGPVLERTRLHWLGDLNGAQRVLLLGDGDGRFLSRFASTYPAAEVHYIDSSARMLDLARRRVRRAERAGSDRVIFTQGNALRTALPGQDYDLVVSHFFLDCFDESELSRLAAHIGPRLAPNVRWVVSDFREPRHGPMAPVFQLYLRLMFLFFHYTSGLETRRLADYSAFLKRLGLVRNRKATNLGGFVFSEIWSRSPERKWGLCDAPNESGRQQDN